MVKPAQLEMLSESQHPMYFDAASFVNQQSQSNADGLSNIYTLKDPEDYSLVDNLASMTCIYLKFRVQKCNNQTSEVTCADFGSHNEHLKTTYTLQDLQLLQQSIL